MRIFTLLAVIFASLLPLSGHAQATVNAQHLSVGLVVPQAQIYPGERFTAGLHFKLAPGWHVYWVNAGDAGGPPAIQWNLPAGVTAGAMQFPAPKRLPLGPLMDYGYPDEVLFPIPMQVAQSFKPSGSTATLGGKVDWLVCSNVCIPGHATLSIQRAALGAAPAHPTVDAAAQHLVDRFLKAVPTPLPSGDAAKFTSTSTGFTLTVKTGRHETSAEFFPLDQNIISNPAPQPVRFARDGVEVSLTKDPTLSSTPAKLNGVLELASGHAYVVHVTPGTLNLSFAPTVSGSGLLKILLLAFVGGIILNLMPCVFPVLFLKGLALVRSSTEERRQARLSGWAYTFGIVVSFWVVVGLLLALRAAGHNLGWGFQFQSPMFLVLMALLLFFLGLSLAGQFQIGLSLTSKGSGLAAKQGYTGSFFTGVLAVVVATPCTAPLMGVAIGYALAASGKVSFAVFTAVALGLAAPYMLLAYNPGWTRLLPKPGAWMEILERIVSIPIFATVIWLVWVFSRGADASALVFLLTAFLLVAIAGWVLGHWPAKAPATIAAVLTLALAVAVPAYALHILNPSTAQAGTNTESASVWQPFTPQLVAQYRAEGKPVFVDFTADWCLSCQVNQRVVLDRADVQQKFKSSGVELVRADWTRRDPAITTALAALGRSGVPAYVLYPSNPTAPPHLLPEVLTPGIVFRALDEVTGK